ncbi:MAG: hypothetical protein WBA39_14585 [Rivularia sp. (in: cyanobacteria)]
MEFTWKAPANALFSIIYLLALQIIAGALRLQPITNYQLPITNYQSPIPHAQLPITNYQSPIPHAQSPITNCELLIS